MALVHPVSEQFDLAGDNTRARSHHSSGLIGRSSQHLGFDQSGSTRLFGPTSRPVCSSEALALRGFPRSSVSETRVPLRFYIDTLSASTRVPLIQICD